MIRNITSHKVNGLNESIDISTLDEPGSGGAHHEYELFLFTPSDGLERGEHSGGFSVTIRFQNGPIAEAGVNGISNEALLAIVEDRLKCFQAGQYQCRENAIALTHVQDAMHWLHHRTRERMARGVEGTSSK